MSREYIVRVPEGADVVEILEVSSHGYRHMIQYEVSDLQPADMVCERKVIFYDGFKWEIACDCTLIMYPSTLGPFCYKCGGRIVTGEGE